MEKIEFKSQVCTTRKQSQKLLQLGLRESTADCHWFYHLPTSTWCIVARPYDGIGTYYPAWSLHRLLCMLPRYVRKEYIDFGRKYIAALDLIIDGDLGIGYKEGVDEPCYDETFYAKDIYTSLCDCIEWLIKEGYFNKDYLEEKK